MQGMFPAAKVGYSMTALFTCDQPAVVDVHSTACCMPCTYRITVGTMTNHIARG